MHFQYLIIHCTATPAGRWVSPEDVKRWHTAPKPYGNGWKQVGYSDLILLDGSRHQFVKHNNDQIIDSFEITNGVAGINAISRHLCYVGGLDKTFQKALDTRTPQQIETMLTIIQEVLAYAPDIKIAGHNQFASKACPSFFVPEWLRMVGIAERNIEGRKSVKI
ncbi:N-acetylmuramoyl-L-alanine amidase [Cytophagaceae bacterium DM2B3-1]|uniref:N-acetylmuramoyl-L-alanine amidase n=1 Tax=Xanthocytophaga flava TaxID=3048013 RepID=A0ABT7CDM3_9BACT|nr:N-acetylmuramoyl-L-alanine amidase [Xanthocytophaga flavus]MDJ1491818.1 N-acetylmuramoyl-L-alanine amidase [Xanthocytophaga flavus]